jgi:hypothetical protein
MVNALAAEWSTDATALPSRDGNGDECVDSRGDGDREDENKDASPSSTPAGFGIEMRDRGDEEPGTLRL